MARTASRPIRSTDKTSHRQFFAGMDDAGLGGQRRRRGLSVERKRRWYVWVRDQTLYAGTWSFYVPLSAMSSSVGSSTSGSYIPDTLILNAYQPNATARKVVQLLPGFSTVDANGQSRPFQTSMVGGTNASSGDSVVVTTRSDYELGASGNLLATYDDGALQASRYETGYGYITASGARFYYHRDHLGNIRAVSNASGNTVRWTDYYAYGAIRDEWSVQTGRDNYGFIGKELDRENGLNYFGARYFDALVGTWNSVDPLWAKYPQFSPYVYAANNPTSAYDPDGRLVIFINGNHNDGSGGKPEYWRGLTNGQFRSFDTEIMKHFNDTKNPIYRDGSLGGNAHFNFESLISITRQQRGYAQGFEDAKQIISGLDTKDGKIAESIKIVSHSMGAAFARGYIAGLMQYAKQKGITGLQVHDISFAPFQSIGLWDLSNIEGVKSYQIGSALDPVINNLFLFSIFSGNLSKDVKERILKMDLSKNESFFHGILNFLDEIENLPDGQYEYKDGKFIPKN